MNLAQWIDQSYPEVVVREVHRTSGRCCICEKPFSLTRRPAIDHDHRTGLWRGVPCSECNLELGLQHENAKKLRNMADYLDAPPLAHLRIYVPGSAGAEGLIP